MMSGPRPFLIFTAILFELGRACLFAAAGIDQVSSLFNSAVRRSIQALRIWGC